MKIGLIMMCFAFSGLKAQDTLPLLEVRTPHLKAFSNGQLHMVADSQTQKVWQTGSVADILQRTSPLSMRVYGSSNGTVAARGMGASHTAVLWNGINIQNAGTGSFDLTLLTLSSVQQVAYKLGGGSALFGSGAVGATLFLDNDKPQQRGLHGQFGADFGQNGFKNSHFSLGFGKKKWALAAEAAHQSAENNFWFRNTADIGAPLRRADNARFHRTNLTAHFFFKINSKQDWQTHYWQSWSYRQATPTMTARNDRAYLRDSAQRWVSEWRYFGLKTVFKARLAYIKDKNFYASDVVANSQNGVSSTIFEVENQYIIKEKYKLRTGLNLTNDASNNNNLNTTPSRLRAAIFVQQALPTRWGNLSLNVRQEWLKERLPLTFSAGYSRLWAAKKGQKSWILRGAFSRNYNLPSFNDLYWAGLGVPTLQAEQGYSAEMGLDWHFKKHKTAFSAHMTVFDIRMNNRILWLPQPDGLWRPSNVNQLFSRGIEVFLKYNFEFNKYLNTYLSANYAFVKARDGQGGVPLYVPQHKGSLNAQVKYQSAFIAWYQTVASRHFSAADKSAWAAAFTISDLSAGWEKRVKWGEKAYRVRLYGRLDNVFNQDYQIIRFYPQPRRQWQLGVSFLF